MNVNYLFSHVRAEWATHEHLGHSRPDTIHARDFSFGPIPIWQTVQKEKIL